MDVSHYRIRCRSPTPPGETGAGALAFAPDYFTPHEEADLDHSLGDEMRERHVRTSAEVRNVDDGTASRLELAVCLSKHPLKKVEVVLEAGIRVILLANVVRRRRHHEGNAVVL